jgi:hypothetical protein
MRLQVMLVLASLVSSLEPTHFLFEVLSKVRIPLAAVGEAATLRLPKPLHCLH